jgi:dihydroorotate dehydrogenase (NAD+) catalytic subunit
MNGSGTFGTAPYGEHIDFSRIGAVVAKSVTQNPRQGNPPPRIAEVRSGVLNAVGIQNAGVREFIERKLPEMRAFDVPLIVSVSNTMLDDFGRSVALLEQADGIAAYEINVSCPNLECGGRAFGMSPDDTRRVAESVRREVRSSRPVIVKLTPNVTDIVEIAKAAADGGADALTVANTYIGMAVDLRTRRPVLGNTFGGVSGPAIKPLTMRHVFNVSRAVPLPVIASGGICSAEDALEYLMAGATAVQAGSANFSDPAIMERIVDGIAAYLSAEKIASLSAFIGSIVA